MEPLPCATFEDAFAAIQDGAAELGMIPIENSIAGRVADIHHLLPDVGPAHRRRAFPAEPVPADGAAGRDARRPSRRSIAMCMRSAQCRKIIRKLGMKAVVARRYRRARRARSRSANDPTRAALVASSLAAEIYGLDMLAERHRGRDHNTTRFVILSQRRRLEPGEQGTGRHEFVFRVRYVPAALYKALGGFATNGVNMTKLESYMIDGNFIAASSTPRSTAIPRTQAVRLALEELNFFSREVRILGVYPRHPFRDFFRGAVRRTVVARGGLTAPHLSGASRHHPLRVVTGRRWPRNRPDAMT